MLKRHKKANGIDYFAHEPTRKCGIHIRGFAQLCGVTHRVIQSALQNAQKGGGDLAQTRETELYKILKNRDVFLEDLAQISPTLNGKSVKVILSDVCFDVAS